MQSAALQAPVPTGSARGCRTATRRAPGARAARALRIGPAGCACGEQRGGRPSLCAPGRGWVCCRSSTAACEARRRAGFGTDKKRKGLLDWYFNSRAEAPKPREGALARSTPMRIEPKTFFANERTFLSWRAAALL